MTSWKYVAASMTAQVAQLLTTLVLGIFLPRVLDTYSYGLYRTLRSIPQAVFGISSFLSAQTIIYFTSSSKDKAKIFWNMFLVLLVSSVSSAFFLLVFSKYFALQYSVPVFLVVLASAEVFYFSIMPLFYNYLKGLGNFVLSSKVIMLSHLLRAGTLVFALFFGIYGIFIWRNIYGALLLLISLFLLKNYVKPQKPDFSLLKRLVKYDFHLFINRFLSGFSLNFIILALGKVNPKEVAYYSIAFFLANMISVLTAPVFEVGLFKVSGGDVHSKMRKVTKYTTYLAGFIFTFYIAFGKEIISLLFPRDYLNAVPALYILALSYYISTLTSGVSLYFLKVEKTVAFSKAILLKSFAIFLLSYFLIPSYLATGAALTYLLATLLYVFYMNFTFKSTGAGRTYVVLSFLASLGSILIGKILSKLLPTLFSLFIVPVFSFLFYLIVLAFLRGFDEYDLRVAHDVFGEVKKRVSTCRWLRKGTSP